MPDMRAGTGQRSTSRRILTGVLAAGIALVACGDGDASDAAAPQSEPPGATTASTGLSTTTASTAADPPTATATRTTATTAPADDPPPYSFDGSVPPPELVNTGDDHEAIFRSLNAYGDWLAAHNPDPDLLDEAYLPGTDLHERFRHDLEVLADNEWRLVYDDLDIDVEVVSVEDHVVSLLVASVSSAVRIVDRRGGVTEERPTADAEHWIALLAADGRTRWRLADVTAANVDLTYEVRR